MARLHVILDARALRPHLDGIGRFSLNLMAALADRPELKLTALIPSGLPPQIRARLPQNLGLITLPGSHLSVRALHKLPRLIDEIKADLFHSLHALLPPRLDRPAILTLHDTMWLTKPWLQESPASWRYWAGALHARLFIGRGLERARLVLTVSQASAKDIAGFRPSLSPKLRVISEAPDPVFLKPPESGRVAEALARFGLAPEGYLLYAGNTKPYKNLPNLLQALALTRSQPPMRLIMAGRPDRFYRRLLSLIKGLGLQDRVSHLGSRLDEELVCLMAGARGLVFPSLWEGFGLPVLEAMALGRPVLTSHRGGLVESAGQAALIVDPEDVEGMALSLDRLWTEEDLRAELTARGREWVKNFSWTKTAEEVARIYEEVS
ncbi:MAG: glycosyltransferase family 4 protein [Deltaproteobacteria bacterium]|nr:glycosyltransferase family 4 protein [Deltaproteobacteria bacterium]